MARKGYREVLRLLLFCAILAASSACDSSSGPPPGPTIDWGPYKTVVHEAMLSTLVASTPSTPTARPTQPGVTPTRWPPATSSAPSTVTSTPSPAPTPAETTGEECEISFRFLRDVTVPDGSVMQPGQAFTKTWRIENSGDCTWGAHLKLRHVAGERLASADEVAIPPTEPGQTVDLSIDMQAPEEPGSYRSDWRLCASPDACFGPAIYVEIVVGEPTTAP